jgi:hypothetical protein
VFVLICFIRGIRAIRGELASEMEIQWLLTAVVVALAAIYLLRRAWKTWFTKSGCGGSCGCGAAPKVSPTSTLIPADQLRLRSQNRAGEK